MTGHVILDHVTVDFGGSGWGVGGGRRLGTGQGQGQWWVVVGVPRWYMDGRDDIVVGAVGTDCVYCDRVCQQSWRWYRVMVHCVHHQGDDDNVVVVVISDVPAFGHCPK
jgi:hypothetical protein